MKNWRNLDCGIDDLGCVFVLLLRMGRWWMTNMLKMANIG